MARAHDAERAGGRSHLLTEALDNAKQATAELRELVQVGRVGQGRPR
jgi:hypothetical protein